MEVQETRNERIVQTAHGVRLNPEYLKQLASEHREALTLLAKKDGPIQQVDPTTKP